MEAADIKRTHRGCNCGIVKEEIKRQYCISCLPRLVSSSQSSIINPRAPRFYTFPTFARFLAFKRRSVKGTSDLDTTPLLPFIKGESSGAAFVARFDSIDC